MDNAIARKLQLIVKSCIFITLAIFTVNTYATCVYMGPKCGKKIVWVKKHYRGECGRWCSVKRAYPVYRGPYNCCYYYGPCCSTLVWVPCHWDTYGNYVSGYWTTY